MFPFQDTCIVKPQILFLEGITVLGHLDHQSQMLAHRLYEDSKDEWHVGLLPRSALRDRLSPIRLVSLIYISQSAMNFRLIEIIEVLSRRRGYVHRESISKHSQFTGSQLLASPCTQPCRAHTLTTA